MKNFQKAVVPVAGALMFLLCVFSLLAVICGIAWRNCLFEDCAPHRNFTEFDMEIPEGFFPESATIDKLEFIRNDTGDDPAVSTNFWYKGKSTYRVNIFPSFSSAKQEYNFTLKYNPFTGPGDPSLPSLMNKYKVRADESTIRCGLMIRYQQCFFIARYEEVVVVFSSTINAEMSEENFFSIVKYIDSQVYDLLMGN